MRRIKKANIKFLSLVPRGANRLPVIYKAEDGALDVDMLVKVADDFMDKGELTAVVYAPELRDAQGDIASACVIKDMMYEAAKQGLSIDIRHNEKPLAKEQVYIAESFIVQKNDPRFEGMKDYNGKLVDVVGAWGIVAKVEDKELRNLYKEGKWNGISMGGTALLQSEKEDSKDSELVEKVAKKLARHMGLDTGDFDMSKDELKEVIKEQNESLVQAIAKALKPVVIEAENKPDDKKADASTTLVAPIFKGDFSKPEDVKAHAEAVKRYNLAKAVDWNDPESVAKYGDELAKMNDGKKADVPAESDEVKRLKKQLEEAMKSSNQTVNADGQGNKSASATHEGVSKEDVDCFAMGSKMAKAMNGGK